MSDLIGQTIDHYRIERLLGQGGMGMIYQATDLKLQRPVALKVMHEHLASHQQFQERFSQEARAAAGLDHPNIVRVIHFNPTPRQLYIVMELITGGSLREYINRMRGAGRQIDVEEALQLVHQIADALNYAHESGMVHRDVKPENILLKPVTATGDRFPNQAMLTDFGLAKMSESLSLTVAGRPLGTFPYMSPEQCRAETVDGGTDIYALGVVLYELTVGRLPFEPRNLPEALRMHTLDKVPAPSDYIPGFNKTLEAIIFKCLTKKRQDRYQTASDMATALWWLQVDLKSSLPTPTEDKPTNPENIATDAPAVIVPVVNPPPVIAPPAYKPISQQFDTAPEDFQDPPTQPEPEPLPPKQDIKLQDRIVVSLNGKQVGVVPIQRQAMMIGRDPKRDIVLPEKPVSRDHARIERTNDGAYWVRDLGSTNGTRIEETVLVKDKPEAWGFGQTLYIGNFVLRLEPAAGKVIPKAQPKASSSESPMSFIPSYRPSAMGGDGGEVLVMLSPSNVKLQAGESAEIQVELSNQTIIQDTFSLEVRGVPGEWATLAREIFMLNEGQSASTTMSFIPPRRWTSRAGRHVFSLRVHSASQQMEVTKTTGVLHIAAFQDYLLELHPKRLHDGGVTTLTITNNGNAITDFSLRARDRENGLSFHYDRTHMSLEPGQSGEISIEVKPRPSALVHGAKLLPFDVTVVAADGEPRSVRGEVMAVAYMVSTQPVAAAVGNVAHGVASPYDEYLRAESLPSPVMDYSQAYEPDPYAPVSALDRERGGCLTLWLLMYSVFGLLAIPGLILAAIYVAQLAITNLNDSWPFVLLLLSGWVSALIYGLLIIQIWNWRRWALHIVMFFSFFALPLGPFVTLTWWLLTRNKRGMFS